MFTAGPYAGQSFTLSGFELGRSAGEQGADVYGSPASPVLQTVSLADGMKFERVCVLTMSATPLR